MRIGVVLPQGWFTEYRGRDPRAAWAQTVAVARQADRLGFDSIWLYDHFHTVPLPEDEIVFEPFTALSALAALTSRVRIGHIVVCTGFRNPALTAKMISTLDTISGGRAELGIGAGWKREEWLAYGYDFPSTRERLEMLADHLEVITRMLEPGDRERATFHGSHARVQDAINRPKPLQQPRLPIMVGGRAESRRHDARRGGGGAADHPTSLRGDRARPGEPAPLGPHLVRIPRREHSRSGARGSLRRLLDGADALEAFAVDVVAAGATLEPA